MESLISIAFPLFIFTVLVFKWSSSSPKRLKSLPPSPPKLPIIGNLLQLGSIPQRSLKSLAEKYGSLMLLRLGGKPVLIVSSADAAREVLKTHDETFADRPKTNFGRKLLYQYSDIISSAYGEYWRRVRGICMLHLLNEKRVQFFRSIREEEIASMVEKIRQSRASSSIMNVGEMFAALTNDIVCRVTFGRKYSGEEGGSKFKELVADFTDLLGTVTIADYIPWMAWLNHLNGMEAKVNKVAKDFDEFLELVVEEEMNRRKCATSDGDGNESKHQQNFVSVLIELQQSNDTGFVIDRDCVKAILLDMVVGGTDSTSTLLQWAMAELVRHSNSMAKLQGEVRGVVGSKSVITEDDLENMHYLKAVIKETLRLHPPVPLLLPRESRANVKIMGYDISEGTEVIINAWAIGRDPSFWEEPEEFRPERFLNSPIDFKGQYFHFIPFGSGRRSCPGSIFGFGNAMLALAHLMYNFDFALPGGVKAEDLDMIETSGAVAHKKVPLLLVVTPYTGLQQTFKNEIF